MNVPDWREAWLNSSEGFVLQITRIILDNMGVS